MPIDFKLWLKARYEADAKARNQTLLQEFLKRLPAGETLDIIDLGAGMGSNFRFLHPVIDQNQHWTLVDIDKDLLDAVPRFLSKVTGQKITPGKPFHSNEKEIILETRLQNLLNSFSVKISADIIVSNAVFDLFSEDQFDQLVQHLDAPLVYFSINYKGTTFSPSRAADEKYLALYDQHMQRDQDFGNGMGPQCAELMPLIFKKHQFEVITGPSDWVLDTSDPEVQHYLVNFMEEAVPELLKEEKVSDFRNWVKNVQDRIDNRELAIRVKHDDILAVRKTE